MRIRELLIGSLMPFAAHAQLPADSAQAGRYAVVVEAGGGFSLNPGPLGVPAHLDTRAQALGWAGTVRAMWYPDHRLRVGIESGLVDLYRYSIDGPPVDGRVRLTAVPLLLQWSMAVTKHFSVYAGYGTYVLRSDLDYLERTRATTLSLGYAAALHYGRPITPALGWAAELEWMNAAETRNTVLTLQAHLVWRLFSW